MSNNQPFVHKEYLPVADNASVVDEASAILQAGKIVALDASGKINQFFIPYSDLSVTSLSVDDGEKITGDVKLYGLGNISVTRTGTNFYISSEALDGVMSIEADGSLLTGAVVLVPGDGLSISSSELDNKITLQNTGVLSINGLSGDITLQPLGGINVTASSGILQFSLDDVSWDKFDATTEARAQKIVVESGLYLGSSVGASLYHYNNQTVIRGTSGVHFLDPVTLDRAIISGVNGLFLGESRIKEYDGSLHIEPVSGQIVFSSGTELLGVRGIQASYESGSYLVEADGLYGMTFSHGSNLLPLSLLVTYVPGYDSSDFTETTLGMGANLINENGYNVSFDRNSITVQAKLDVSSAPYFKVRCLFLAENSPTDLPSPATITSAPISPTVTLIGAPSSGGYPEQIFVSTRPVENASSYYWVVSGTSWETSTPILSTTTVTGLSFSTPGEFEWSVNGKNSASNGPSISFKTSIKPKQPILSEDIVSIFKSGLFRDVTINLTYQPPCSISIIRDTGGTSQSYVKASTGLPITYVQPGSIIGLPSAVVTEEITIKGLYVNYPYTFKAIAAVGDVQSSASSVINIGPLD